MTPASAIVKRLEATTAVTAIVGARIYQLALPQDLDAKAVRVQEIDDPKAYHLRGVTNGGAPTRIQVDAYVPESSADPVTDVDTLAAAVDAAISGQIFRIGTGPVLEIRGGFRKNRRPAREAAGHIRMLRVMQDYLVWAKPVS